MNNNKLLSYFLVISLILILSSGLRAQNVQKLPRSSPEAEGVSSAGILDFLNAVDTGRVELHSYMFIRHGKVIAEGWWKPYNPAYKHLLFSASKTFTATAVGLAVSENRLKVTDKVISFFPYSLPDSVCDYIKDLTVQNLLTMSVGQDPEPRSMGNNGDWITSFLATEPIQMPGTVFKYNNMATFMLSAIVQQVTGETVFDFLMTRIFKPLEIRGIDWDLNPQGINLGMIGLRLHTEDLAKFGQLLLQEGMWNKKQLIPGTWVKEATSFKIESYEPSNKSPKELNDWAQGYAYQMWRGRNNTVRVDGMGGQFVVLIPEKDAIVVFTANARNTQNELNLMHDYLIPAIKSDKALPPAPDLQSKLLKKNSELRIAPGFKPSSAPEFESIISGKEFVLGNNDYNLQSVYFLFKGKECTLALKRDNNISSIKSGSDEWKITNTSSSSLLAPPRNNFSKSVDANYTVLQPVYKLGAMYSWSDDKTLKITGRFVEESLGSETIVCKFSEQNGEVSVTIEPEVPVTTMRMPMGMRFTVTLRGAMVNIK